MADRYHGELSGTPAKQKEYRAHTTPRTPRQLDLLDSRDFEESARWHARLHNIGIHSPKAHHRLMMLRQAYSVRYDY